MTGETRPARRAALDRRELAAWLVLTVLLLFSIAAPLNQFKVPPIMPVLMSAWQLSVSRAGLLMSVYAATGLVLALPAGLIFQRVGYRITGLLAGGSIALGSALGAASTSVGGLLASRVIEGAGTSFMAVLAPAIIAQWFVEGRRGTAMGVWSAWVPLGSAAMLILAPLLAAGGNWRAVWWFGCAYALAVTALYLLCVRPSPARQTDAEGGGEGTAAVAAGDVLRDRDIWLLGATFAFFNMSLSSFATFFPTFLSAERGLGLAEAGLLGSLMTVITIFSAPAGGLVSDRAGSRRRPYLVGFAACALLLPFAGFLGVGPLIVLVVLLGLFIGLIPTNVFSAAIEAVRDERLGGLAMAVIMVGQNAGMLLGPLIMGALVESPGGWPLAFASLSIMCLLGAATGWLARVR